MQPHRTRFSVGHDTDREDDTEDEDNTQPAPPVIVINDTPASPGPASSSPTLAPADKHQTATDSTLVEKQLSNKIEESASSDGVSYPPQPPHPDDGPSAAVPPVDPEPTSPAAKRWASKLPPLPASLAWIPPKLNWKGYRPVLRASIAAWCGLVLLMGTKSEAVLGQASFLVLVVATINPAAAPIATTIETTIFQFLLVGLSWAWGCLGLFIAWESRVEWKLSKTTYQSVVAAPFVAQGLTGSELTLAVEKAIFSGFFLEARSSAVCAIFMGVAVGFLLWLRGHLGPGPALFGIIFACILQVITFTTASFFPYPYYTIGLVFFLPFVCQQAINLVVTLFVFPETLAHQFADRLIATLHPLQDVIRAQKELLETNPRSADWLKFKTVRAYSNAALGGAALLGMSEANLTREIAFARVSGKDLTKILSSVRVVVGRTAGFVSFYNIIESHLHREESESKGGAMANDLVIHLDKSRPSSPSGSRSGSLSRRNSEDANRLEPSESRTPNRRSSNRDLNAASRSSSTASLAGMEHTTEDEPHDRAVGFQHDLPTPDRHKKRSRSRHRHGHKSASHISLSSLLHDVLHPNIDTRRVGVVESMRYADLEDFLKNPNDEQHLEEIIHHLSKSTSELISILDSTVGHLITSIHRIKRYDSIWSYLFPQKEAEYKSNCQATRILGDELKQTLKLYREDRRLQVVRPYAHLFDPTVLEHADKMHTPSHRGIYWAFSYQFSIMGWADALVDVYDQVAKVEEKRRQPRLWWPDWAKFRFGHNTAEASFEDENPDAALSGMNEHLWRAPRNPDASPPTKLRHLIGVRVARFGGLARRKDVLFGVKAAVILVLCALPAYFKTSSWFFYRQRGIWVVIMAALTLTQYVGDTTFGFVVRVVGTFLGAVAGLLIWSIAAGSGIANPYALGATCAVAFQVLFFVRVHYTPPIAAILPIVTTMLILGYSWQDSHMPALSSVGYGWEVAWRRFVCVMIGISIAFIAVFIPPKTTQKQVVRRTYAKAFSHTGDLFCQVLSFANCKGDNTVTRPPKNIIKALQSLRVRIGKTTASKAMVKFELTLRGPWPAQHYASLQSLQMEILDLIGQFTAVVGSLDQKWTIALLRRTQLANPQFLSQFLNAFHVLSNALEHGQPVPYLFDPLLERYLKSPETVRAGHSYGFDLDVEGVPNHVDLDTLCSLAYLRYSCGVSQIYGIVNRLDRAMLVVKALVGESLIVYGLENLNSARKEDLVPSATQAERDEREGLLREAWGEDEDESRRNSHDSLV